MIRKDFGDIEDETFLNYVVPAGNTVKKYVENITVHYLLHIT